MIFVTGAILDGYAADMTRTVFRGGPSRRGCKLYSAVQIARVEAVQVVRPVAQAAKIDREARRGWARLRQARFFT